MAEETLATQQVQSLPEGDCKRIQDLGIAWYYLFLIIFVGIIIYFYFHRVAVLMP